MIGEEFRDLLIRYYELWDQPGPHRREMGYPMIPPDALFMYGLIIRQAPDVAYESGTAVGWSSAWIALAMDSKPVYTFDPAIRSSLFKPKQGNITYVNDRFESSVDKYMTGVAGKRKFFFIDGDHNHTSVLSDFDAVHGYLESEDILLFHDVATGTGPARALHDIKIRHPEWKYEHIQSRHGMEVVTVCTLQK